MCINCSKFSQAFEWKRAISEKKQNKKKNSLQILWFQFCRVFLLHRWNTLKYVAHMNQGSRFLCHRDYMLTCICMSHAKHAVAISIHGIVPSTWGMVLAVIHLFLDVANNSVHILLSFQILQKIWVTLVTVPFDAAVTVKWTTYGSVVVSFKVSLSWLLSQLSCHNSIMATWKQLMGCGCLLMAA